MLHVSDATFFPVQVGFLVHGLLGPQDQIPAGAGGGTQIETSGHGRTGRSTDIPDGQGLFQVRGVHPADAGVDKAGPVQFAQDGHDSSGPVHIFHMVRGGRGDLAQVRDLPGEPVDIAHGEVDSCRMGDGQQMQNRVGGTAHGYIQGHGIHKGGLGGDGARQDRGIPVVVPGVGHGDNKPGGLFKELRSLGMGGHHGPVAGQGQAQGLIQAVHGVGGKHPGTGAAGGTAATFDLFDIGLRHGLIPGHDHHVDQVVAFVTVATGLHRAAGDEDGGDIQAHGGHQHTGGDLVAVADADHRVHGMGIAHILDAVGDQLA